MDLLKKVYHKYADSWAMQVLGTIYRNGFFWDNYMAYSRVRKISKQKNEEGQIKVVFLGQYPSVWNKLKTVCEAMLKDDRFLVEIIAIPENLNAVTDSTYEFYHELYGDCVVNAYQSGSWYNLKESNPDYVFMQRPYDQYLPDSYASNIISSYTKVCYVNYGYQLLKQTMDVCLSKKFLRNVYLFFAENYLVEDYNTRRFALSHKKKYRKTVNIGYPALEDFMKRGKEYKDEKTGTPKILWTPRWTEDKFLGGSNFLRFKDDVVEYVKKNNASKLVFRPHPMTFDHMVSVGKMTQKEVDDYLAIYAADERLEYDNSKDYTKVFWTSDILLTDISSIIIEYFITGMPIVYCETGAKSDEFFDEILSVLYRVNDWQEAETTLDMLLAGQDPLKEKRMKKVEQLFGGKIENVAERFLEEIYQDYVS